MPSLTERVAANAGALVASGQLPNALVRISRAGKTVCAWQSGRYDIAQPREITADTLFRVFSMSKLITTAAILTLVDKGLVRLDDPASKYVPSFAQMTVRTPAGIVPAETPVTIFHLITHTSGISYMALPSIVAGDYEAAQMFPYLTRETETTAGHVDRLAKLPLAHQPGAAWNYGEGMAVLGRIVEVVSGQRFSAYLRDNLFAPLEMADTDFWAPPAKADRLASLYRITDAGALEDVSNQPYFGGDYRLPAKLEYGGAGLVSTGQDYLNYGLMLLGKGLFKGRRVLSEAAVRQITSDQFHGALGPTPLAALGRGAGYSFGLGGSVRTSLTDPRTPGAVGEYGWGGWAGLSFWIDPAHEIVGVTMTQAIPADLGPYILDHAVRSALYDGKGGVRD